MTPIEHIAAAVLAMSWRARLFTAATVYHWQNAPSPLTGWIEANKTWERGFGKVNLQTEHPSYRIAT